MAFCNPKGGGWLSEISDQKQMDMIEEGYPTEHFTFAFADDKPVANGNMNLRRFQIGKYLGHGTYGPIFVAGHGKTKTKTAGFAVAVKAMDRVNLDASTSCFAEADIHRKVCSHPHILQIYGLFHDLSFIYMILEYAKGGTLKAAIERKELNKAEATRCLRELASALDHCHRKNVIHRDVKPENVLIGLGRSFKLADFGVSVCFAPGQLLTEETGTLKYMAPEMHDHSYGKEVDVWALGVVLHELLLDGEMPFPYNGDKKDFRARIRVDFQPADKLSEPAKDLLRGMLVQEPTKRWSLAKIQDHAWTKQEQGE